MSISKKQFSKIFFHEFISIGSELYKNALKRRVRGNKLYREALEFCQTRSNEEKTKKISKANQEAFVIDEENYMRKHSESIDLSIIEKTESIKETLNNDKEIFENYEDQYVKAFKNRKNSPIHKKFDQNKAKEFPKKIVKKFSNENILSEENSMNSNNDGKKLKNIISNLIQKKRTIKEEVNDLMTSNSKKLKNEEQKSSFLDLHKKASTLENNLVDFLKKLKSSHQKIPTSFLEKIDILLSGKQEKTQKKSLFSEKKPFFSFNDFSILKKSSSIKISSPLINQNHDKNLTLSRIKRDSGNNDLNFKKSFTRIIPSKNINSEEIPLRSKPRSKSIKK